MVVRARFTAGGRLLETEIAATPSKTTRGDDYDTFFQPGGDVVVAGTTGSVSMQSWQAAQTIGIAEGGGLQWSVGYQYRRDRSVFGPGNKTITHTQAASIEASIITTRETTVSQIYGAMIRAQHRWAGRSWSAALRVDVSPITRARLLTQLPDKYPGVDIVFSALANEVKPSFQLCLGRHFPVTVTATYLRSARYKKSGQFIRHAAIVDAGIGWNVW